MRLDDPSKHAGLTSSAKRSEERPPFGVGLVWAAVSTGLAQVASPGEGRGRGQQPPSRDESPPCRTRWSLVRLMGRGSVCGGGGSRRDSCNATLLQQAGQAKWPSTCMMFLYFLHTGKFQTQNKQNTI